jgi:hypothetical protein
MSKKKDGESPNPVVRVVLLQVSSGKRSPQTNITRSYMRKRQVSALADDPFNLSVLTLKEMIWKEWPVGMSWDCFVLLSTLTNDVHIQNLTLAQLPSH